MAFHSDIHEGIAHLVLNKPPVNAFNSAEWAGRLGSEDTMSPDTAALRELWRASSSLVGMVEERGGGARARSRCRVPGGGPGCSCRGLRPESLGTHRGASRLGRSATGKSRRRSPNDSRAPSR